jgi:hypothetical protein
VSASLVPVCRGAAIAELALMIHIKNSEMRVIDCSMINEKQGRFSMNRELKLLSGNQWE